MYPESFIEQLKDRLDIVEVISQYVPTQRKGRDYWACCPFHHEKTPSFQIRHDQQVYRCYGCGKHGNVFTFVMEQDGIGFVEAVELLAKKTGLPLPEQTYNPEEAKKKQLLEKIYAINKETALFYYNNLKTDKGQIALEYLAGRELTRETIQHFGMGYSADFDALPQYLYKKGYDYPSMQAAGVIGINESGKPYDFFGGRLMIPIIGGTGKVLGFTGRLLEAKPDFAKYKNTSTTLAFNKRKNLFGINNYRKYKQNSPRKMILVEGHMDVITLYQAGIPYAVASMGTSLTIEQCREIKRNADIVYVSYDGDSAGQNATIRGLDLLKGQGLDVKVVCLTDNLDPDDYIKKYGRDGYLRLMDEALPLIDFKLKAVAKGHTFSSSDDKVKYAREAIEVLKDLDEVEKAVYVETVSRLSGLDKDVLLGKAKEPPKTTAEPTGKTDDPITEEREQTAVDLAAQFCLSCMYFGCSFVKIVDVNSDYFPKTEHKRIIEYIQECGKTNIYPRADKLYELLDNDEAAAIVDAQETIKRENQADYYANSLRILKKEYFTKEKARLIAELSTEQDENVKKEIKLKIVQLTKLSL